MSLTDGSGVLRQQGDPNWCSTLYSMPRVARGQRGNNIYIYWHTLHWHTVHWHTIYCDVLIKPGNSVCICILSYYILYTIYYILSYSYNISGNSVCISILSYYILYAVIYYILSYTIYCHILITFRVIWDGCTNSDVSMYCHTLIHLGVIGIDILLLSYSYKFSSDSCRYIVNCHTLPHSLNSLNSLNSKSGAVFVR